MPNKDFLRFPLFVFLFSFVLQACGQSGRSYVPLHDSLSIPLGDTALTLHMYTYGERDFPVLLKLHDNEQTAEAAGRRFLEAEGGRMIVLGNGGRRLVRFPLGGRYHQIDPNRMFSAAGIESTLRLYAGHTEEAARAVDSFARTLLRQLPDTGLLVAIHNNTDRNYSISDYLEGGQYASEASAVHIVPGTDTDDFILTTDPALFARYRQAGHNAILQKQPPAVDDGSLSVYYGFARRPYINIETEHAHVEEQSVLLRLLIGEDD